MISAPDGKLAGVLRAGGEQVDPGGLDGGVAQYISQSDHIPAGLVEGSGKQWRRWLAGCKHRLPLRPSGTPLSSPPTPAFWICLAASGERERSRRRRFLCPPVLQQLAAQLTGDQDCADFPFSDTSAAAGGRGGRQVFTSLTRIPVAQMAS